MLDTCSFAGIAEKLESIGDASGFEAGGGGGTEGEAEAGEDNVARWDGVLDCMERGAEEVSVGVEDLEVGWGWG